jgi:tyrosinase
VLINGAIGPPSANGTLDTRMDLGFNGKEYTMRELVSTIDGPFCYIYE